MDFKHIVEKKGVCGGRKIIKGTRLEIEWVRDRLQSQPKEEAYDELINDFELKKEQIKEVEEYYNIGDLKIEASFSFNGKVLALLHKDECGVWKIKYRNNEELPLEACSNLAYWENEICEEYNKDS